MHCLGHLYMEYANILSADSPNQISKVESIDLYFDQREKFKREIEKFTNRKLRIRRASSRDQAWDSIITGRLLWDLLSAPIQVDMRKHPPVQLADMLAWCTNRLSAFGDYKTECLSVIDATPGARKSFAGGDLLRLAVRNARQ